MKFRVSHLIFVTFLVAFALGLRSFAIAIENDAATGMGVLVGELIESFGFTILRAELWTAWSDQFFLWDSTFVCSNRNRHLRSARGKHFECRPGYV